MHTKLARVVVDALGAIVGIRDGNGGVTEFVTSRFDPDTGVTNLMAGSNVITVDKTPAAATPTNQAPATSGSYTHTQSNAATVWPIAHNLGKYPKVLIMDTAGSEVEGDIKYPDINHVTLTFSSAFAGKAFLD